MESYKIVRWGVILPNGWILLNIGMMLEILHYFVMQDFESYIT